MTLSAKKIWRKLEAKYLTKTIQNQNHLLRKFYRIEMRPGISMEEHLNDFTRMHTDLVNLGVDVSDESKPVCLLNSLHDDYEHLATTLTYGKEKMVYEDISAVLLNHACMRKEKKESKSSTSKASVSRGRQKEKKGHGTRSTAKWILDYAATFHCCPLREWFSSFEKMENASVVLMRSDNPCQIMGVGNIRLKMFDGIMGELKNVRFVPNMKKNLISLGYLEAKGYIYGAQDGILKVSSGAMTC
ncbi:hypothetical protein V2J09_023019 [Rumex salicifolius]